MLIEPALLMLGAGIVLGYTIGVLVSDCRGRKRVRSKLSLVRSAPVALRRPDQGLPPLRVAGDKR